MNGVEIGKWRIEGWRATATFVAILAAAELVICAALFALVRWLQ